MERDEEETLDRLKSVRATIIDLLFSRYGGRIVKLMGDGTLADLSSVVSAVQCAIDIQEAIAKENASSDDRSDIAFRIDLHLGDVIVEDDDIYGDGVNIASRLVSIALQAASCFRGMCITMSKPTIATFGKSSSPIPSMCNFWPPILTTSAWSDCALRQDPTTLHDQTEAVSPDIANEA